MTGLRIYIEDTLASQCGNACVARMGFESNDVMRTVVSSEFTQGYHHAVRVFYTALNLLDISGVDNVDPEQIRALKEGLENYLTGRKP